MVTKHKKRKGSDFFRDRKFLSVNDLLQQCHMLTIEERSEWTRLKNVVRFLNSPVPELNTFFLL